MSTATASYSLRDLQSRADMDAVVDVIYQAQYRPYMPSAQILFPIFGYTEDNRVRGIATTKDRLWSDFTKGDQSKHWVVVIETATNKIIAAALWEQYDACPFPDGKPKLDIDWWPEGEARQFCEEVFQQTMIPRSLWMKRPHGGKSDGLGAVSDAKQYPGVSNMIVLPEHRNKGVGSLMMGWGNKHLDDTGLEGFVEASELGRALYEKAGYRVVMKLDFFLPLSRPLSWYKLEHELKMPPWYTMWRPPRGRIEVGQRDRPWQQEE